MKGGPRGLYATKERRERASVEPSEEPSVQNANPVKRSTAIFLAIYVTRMRIKNDVSKGSTDEFFFE